MAPSIHPMIMRCKAAQETPSGQILTLRKPYFPTYSGNTNPPLHSSRVIAGVKRRIVCKPCHQDGHNSSHHKLQGQIEKFKAKITAMSDKVEASKTREEGCANHRSKNLPETLSVALALHVGQIPRGRETTAGEPSPAGFMGQNNGANMTQAS